jgi:hypothetical protein
MLEQGEQYRIESARGSPRSLAGVSRHPFV